MVKDYCLTALLSGSVFLAGPFQTCQAGENLLRNSGFEAARVQGGSPPDWSTTADSAGQARLSDREAHSGRQCLAVPGGTAIEQRIGKAAPGAYVFRGWIKSDSDQTVTLVLQDPEQPTTAYTYADLKVSKGKWVPVEAFCVVEQEGPLSITLGGMSLEYRKYHGGTSEMRSPILVDDCELTRFQPPSPPAPKVWDAGAVSGDLDWKAAHGWSLVDAPSHAFASTAVFQDGHLVGQVHPQDGSLSLYALDGEQVHPRALITPGPGFGTAKSSLVQADGKVGLRIASEHAEHSYTAWLSPKGVIEVDPHQVSQFRVQQCQLRYGLLPSFVGSDICYAPQKLTGMHDLRLPSARWFVGLRDGHDSMLVAVWKSEVQNASLTLSGEGQNRLIDAFSISTDKGGFALSFVEHANLWHQQALNEDWLGEYVPLAWQRPFPARWMAEFFVTAGGKPSFRNPHMGYSFPIADAKTRMWGVWFEDWNHYPFYFDGSRTMAHFEKSFVPNGEALIYFLEPAAADLPSPCEIVEQVLGREQAAKLFDFAGNHVRKLPYSTPNEFMYDRPVCATTTRLSGIKKEEKPTVGINLATHLFEFIRGIRERVDQYTAFFDQMKSYLESEEKAHPESQAYIAELKAMATDAQAHAQEIYGTPLSTVQTKIDGMKKLLSEGKGDGFDCGSLDVRGTAGAQDDLCRRDNRLVLRLAQTAALKCGDSPENGVIADHIWQQARAVLRLPTRWEPRRTLYFFEP